MDFLKRRRFRKFTTIGFENGNYLPKEMIKREILRRNSTQQERRKV
jgi:hypothetical protein